MATQSPLLDRARTEPLCASLVFFLTLGVKSTKRQNGVTENKPLVSQMFLDSECTLI